MTRKHYVMLAAALARVKPSADPVAGCDVPECAQHRADCEAIADALAEDNARFDRARFLKACGIE